MTTPIEVRQTVEFEKWFGRLRDKVAQARVIDRLRRVRVGNFGDVTSIGDQVSEFRFHFGPGYRIYFTQKADGTVVLLLAGGDKSTQHRDIAVLR